VPIWLVVETKLWGIRFLFGRLRALLRSRERERNRNERLFVLSFLPSKLGDLLGV
jgi:hypothetical protein